MDIEDEKESSSGLIYILHSKRLARLVRAERGAEGGGGGGQGEGDDQS